MGVRDARNVLLAALAVASPAGAGIVSAPTMTGSVGVDLDDFTFRKEILESGEQSEVDRSLRDPHLDLRVAGLLLAEGFADYAVTGRLSGAYYSSTAEGQSSNGSEGPSLSRYSGRLSLFTGRSYPLAIYGSRSEVPSLRYEVSNRAESALDSPALAVIRRYDSVLEQRGAILKTALPRGADLSVEVKRNEDRIRRRYDFDEDRDIFVDIATFRPDPIAAVHPVTVRNELTDDAVLLFIDAALVDTLAAGEVVILSIDKGVYDVEFVPLTLNSFRATIDVNGDMQWRIIHEPPPGAKDIAQRIDSARSVLHVGGEGAFKDEAVFEYTDTQEDVQRMTSQLASFNNNASYSLSPTARMDFLTTWTSTDTEIEDVSSQGTDSFQHQTSARWQRHRSTSAQASHSYGRTSTTTDVTSVVSNTHTILTSVNQPTGWKGHEAAARLNATLLSDDLGYASRQYTGELDNRLDFHARGIRWMPRQLVKYTTSSRENPDGSTDEIETQSVAVGEMSDASVFDRVKFKGELTWRRRNTDADVATKRKYLGELGLISKVRFMKLSFTTTHEKEVFGSTVSAAGVDVAGTALEDQLRHSYRLDAQTVEGPVNAGVGVMLVTSNDTRINRITATLGAKVPKLDIPIRSSLMNERRSLTGLPDQQLFQVQTRMSFSFRRVRLVVTHDLIRDRQLTEEYRYQKLLAKITRDFTILGGGQG